MNIDRDEMARKINELNEKFSDFYNALDAIPTYELERYYIALHELEDEIWKQLE